MGGSSLTTADTILSAGAAQSPTRFDKVKHWLPWVLPLLAVGLPLLGFSVAASIPDFALRAGGAGTSLGRGDFLIPVLILCMEAIRRWLFEVKGGPVLSFFGVVASLICVLAVAVCMYAFADATSLPTPTTDSARSVDAITWFCLAAGVITGTMAVIATRPKSKQAAATRSRGH